MITFLEYGRREMRISSAIVTGPMPVNSPHQHWMILCMLVVHMPSNWRTRDHHPKLSRAFLVITMNCSLFPHIRFYYLDRMFPLICKRQCPRPGKSSVWITQNGLIPRHTLISMVNQKDLWRPIMFCVNPVGTVWIARGDSSTWAQTSPKFRPSAVSDCWSS